MFQPYDLRLYITDLIRKYLDMNKMRTGSEGLEVDIEGVDSVLEVVLGEEAEEAVKDWEADREGNIKENGEIFGHGLPEAVAGLPGVDDNADKHLLRRVIWLKII